MHLVILSGAARPKSKSNTAKIIAAFQAGYEACGNTTEVFYLSDRGQWPAAAQSFTAHDNILIALPLYVENIPGILLEFLEGLQPKTTLPVRSWLFCCRAASRRLPRAGAAKHMCRRCPRSWAVPTAGH